MKKQPQIKVPHNKLLIWTKPKTNGDVVITVGYEKTRGGVAHIHFRGSSTVWHWSDGTRCPIFLEEELSAIYTKWKWRRDDG